MLRQETIPAFYSLANVAIRPEVSKELIEYVRMDVRTRLSYG